MWLRRLADGDVFPRARRGGEIFRDFIVEGEPAIFGEQEDRGGGELLADGAQLENGLRLHGNVELDICEAVALRFHGPPVADYGEGQAGDVLFAELRCDVGIDVVGGLRWRAKCCTRVAAEAESAED